MNPCVSIWQSYLDLVGYAFMNLVCHFGVIVDKGLKALWLEQPYVPKRRHLPERRK